MQYASSLLGNTRKWEDRYEILGDDIIIFNDNLASKYLELMEHFGVPINATKSVVSVGGREVVEYAKRTSIKGVDVSPLSWKMFLAQDTFNGRLAITQHLASKGLAKVNRLFNIILANSKWDTRPLKDEYSMLALLTSYAKSGLLPLEFLLRLITSQETLKVVKTGTVDFIKFDLNQARRIADYLLTHKDVPWDLLPPVTSSMGVQET